ncbi:MAG: hypothetical protein OXU69_15895 [Gemmatimonadota bacterium]|nr:hypothetical protein [Gemmatimonadota bacterium]MDE2986185.1 hypothetical protein [Gemmatimonadota bacterium]
MRSRRLQVLVSDDPDHRMRRVAAVIRTTIAAALAVLFGGACGDSSSPVAEPAHFRQSDSAYVIRAVEARFGQGELDDGQEREQIVFGSILDVDRTPSGWAIVDGLNDHIVLLDSALNPLRIVGRVGEGPGEFQSPFQLSMLGDTMAVFDMSAGRISYLGPEGDFLRVSEPVRRFAMTFAFHPASGVFFPVLSEHHYLLRTTGDRQSLVAPIPADFRREVVDDDWSRLRDGNAKTFDGRYLVLDGGWTPELVLARTELVVRPVGEEGSD